MATENNEMGVDLIKTLVAEFKKLQQEEKLPKNISSAEMIDCISTLLKNNPDLSLNDLKNDLKLEKNENILAMAFLATLANQPELAKGFLKFIAIPEEQLKNDERLGLGFKLLQEKLAKELENNPDWQQAFDKCLETNKRLELPTPEPAPANKKEEEDESLLQKMYIETVMGHSIAGGEIKGQIAGATDSAGLVENNILDSAIESTLDFITHNLCGIEKPEVKQEENEPYESIMTKKIRQGFRPPGSQE
jgi:hypothetical protein